MLNRSEAMKLRGDRQKRQEHSRAVDSFADIFRLPLMVRCPVGSTLWFANRLGSQT